MGSCFGCLQGFVVGTPKESLCPLPSPETFQISDEPCGYSRRLVAVPLEKQYGYLGKSTLSDFLVALKKGLSDRQNWLAD